jgi:exodeoxyribonuclease V alpha subunit
VEAGAVLGDIVGPAALPSSPDAGPEPRQEATSVRSQRGIVVLRRVHRFGKQISALADAVSAGDEAETLDLLSEGTGDPNGTRTLRWIDPGPAERFDEPSLGPVRTGVVAASAALTQAAAEGMGAAALALVEASRVLCAHREGPYGVGAWTARVEAWLRDAMPGYGEGDEWYPGRPVLVTRNDYEIQLYNGDTGVVVRRPDGTRTVIFERRGRLYEVSPNRLEGVQTLHASTVHKAQGSQFDAVVVVLPEASSRILTRELLYTAITRARTQVTVVGEESSVRAALRRPIGRASGLGDRLWEPKS